MDNYGKSKQVSEAVRRCLMIYADMLGSPNAAKQGTYGFVPGLNMDSEAKELRGQLRRLDQGVFQVLFTGGFNSGKSTMLNALMRKEILRTAITAETAVVTRIVFGKEEKIIICRKTVNPKTGRPLTKVMSVQEFFDVFRVSQENPKKFEEIDFVVLQQEEEGIGGNLVQLVDSPGTENSEEDTRAARRFAKSANAIVHLINAVQPFVEGDKDYIAGHYAGKHMRNLFFVINHIDGVNPDQIPALKQTVREQLKEVFTDEQGRFDEALFASRVFYTNAYGSLMTRLGRPAASIMGQKIYVEDQDTGVPQFEEALSQFLTADDRDKAAFSSYMAQLASKYVNAMDTIHKTLENYRGGIDVLREKQQDLTDKRSQLETIIDQIEESCRTCVANILLSARSEYSSCVNRILSGWDSHFKDVQIPFKMTDMIGMAMNNNKEKAKKRTEPFANAIQEYIKEEFGKSGAALSTALGGHLDRLESQLGLLEKQLDALNVPISMEDVRKKLLADLKLRGADIEFNGGSGNANLFQIILGAVGMDPEIMLEGMTGRASNGKALVDFLVKNVLEYIAIYVVAWPIGLAMLAYRLISMIKGGFRARDNMAGEILLAMKDDTVKSLRAEEERYVKEIEGQVSAITRAGGTAAAGIRGQVDDYSKNLEKTIQDMDSKSSSYQDEKQRTDQIGKILLGSLSRVNTVLNGKPLSQEDVRKMAVKG